MTTKVNVALIGSGNIGTDLLIKALRSDIINPVWMVGIEENSEGLKRAKELGVKTTHLGIDGLIPHLKQDNILIAFDATSAYVHKENSDKLQAAGVKVIDLTPAAIGPYCVPSVNLQEHINSDEPNVNMVTCGGQPLFRLLLRLAEFNKWIMEKLSPPSLLSRQAPGLVRTSMSLPVQLRGQSNK